jgi:hypothetical protein
VNGVQRVAGSNPPPEPLVYPTLTLKLSVSHLSDQLAKLIIREMSARISDSLSNVVPDALSAHNARVIIRQPKLTLSLYSQRTAQMLFVNAHLGPPNSAVHDVSLTYLLKRGSRRQTCPASRTSSTIRRAPYVRSLRRKLVPHRLRFELTFTPRPVSPTGLSHTVVDWRMAVAVYSPLI